MVDNVSPNEHIDQLLTSNDAQRRRPSTIIDDEPKLNGQKQKYKSFWKQFIMKKGVVVVKQNCGKKLSFYAMVNLFNVFTKIWSLQIDCCRIRLQLFLCVK